MMNYFKKYKNIEVNIIWVIVKHAYHETCIWPLYSVVINANANRVSYFYCNSLTSKIVFVSNTLFNCLTTETAIAIHTYWVSFRSFTGKKGDLINLITTVDS